MIISVMKPPSETSGVTTESEFPVPDLVHVYIAATLITLTIIITQLIVMLVSIRRNLLQSFRGDDSEIPKRTPSDSVTLAHGNVHFAGYFIGYLLWGYVLVTFLVFIVVMSIGAFIQFGSVHFVEEVLKYSIPVFLIVALKDSIRMQKIDQKHFVW